MKIIKNILIIFLIYILVVIGLPYGIMKYSSYDNYKSSFLNEENIQISMDAGKNYYPFMLNYNPTNQYSELRNKDIDLDIYYNFGELGLNGKSKIYQVDTDMYNAFYGAYAIRYNDDLVDLTNNYNEIIEISNFDLKTLVLKSIGDSNPFVKYTIKDGYKDIIINGLDYKVVDSDIIIDGFAHQYQKFYQAYIQYGLPYKTNESFKTINGFGRMYIHYDEIKNINIILYIIAPTKNSLQYMEDNFIFSTKISNIQ